MPKRFDFAWVAKREGTQKGVVLQEAMWNQGEIISCSFLGNPPGSLCKRVEAAAKEWIDRTEISLLFEFPKNTKRTDIRISFDYEGSWSMIGRSCRLETDEKLPTMNFGWLDESTSDGEVRAVVLHEFGHALGMVHEHQHPEHAIAWNKEAIYNELMTPPYNWTKQDVDFNLFQPYTDEETNSGQFDKDSIMIYEIPEHWTTNGFSSRRNMDLSDEDIRFIREQYP
jgi:hypothetical protein